MKKVIVLGATGLIGQQFMRILADHPEFEISHAFASSRSAGKKMGDIWKLPFFHIPASISNIKVENIDKIQSHDDFDIAFSGLPASIAQNLEYELRNQGISVFSNTSSHRMNDDVPILIPEVNKDHLELAKIQKEKYGGFIVTNANCSVTGASMYLSALRDIIDYHTVIISTYQALSGAGLNGVSSLQSTDNVIPFIKNEEHKIKIEAQKILGSVQDGKIIPFNVNVMANAARVPVIDGHTEAITTISNKEYPIDSIIHHFQNYENPLSNYKLYSSPENHLIYHNEYNRPQPRLDRFNSDLDHQKGMVLSVGRTRKEKNMISSFVLIHNTIRGGAGGSILNAELASKQGLV